jgi:hypothetical protein
LKVRLRRLRATPLRTLDLQRFADYVLMIGNLASFSRHIAEGWEIANSPKDSGDWIQPVRKSSDHSAELRRGYSRINPAGYM